MDIKEVVGDGIVGVYDKNDQKIGCYDPSDPNGLLHLLGVHIVERFERPNLIDKDDFPYHTANLPSGPKPQKFKKPERKRPGDPEPKPRKKRTSRKKKT